MDINFLRGIGTLLAFIAFVSVCVWVYIVKKKSDFEEAAHLPFADEEVQQASGQSNTSPEQEARK